MSICILHANCQGGPLTRLLRLSPAFSRRWDILHITNYDRSPVPSDALEHCSLFLYQHLGPQWGDLASENLLSRLPRNAVSLCLPNLFFMGYWPFWTSDSSIVWDAEAITPVAALEDCAETLTANLTGSGIRLALGPSVPSVAQYASRVFVTTERANDVLSVTDAITEVLPDPATQLVFVTTSHDTRFDASGVIRPLLGDSSGE